MTRLESSAWPLAGGSASVFALAVVLGHLPWQVAFTAVLVALLAWSWRSPLITGAAVGAIAWLCVTGFDVHRLGDLRGTGRDDAVRAAVLVATGVLAASVRAVAGARRGYRRADPVWVDFHETDLGLTETPAHPPHAVQAPRTPGRGIDNG
jgi:hypothetical protein